MANLTEIEHLRAQVDSLRRWVTFLDYIIARIHPCPNCGHKFNVEATRDAATQSGLR